MSNREREFEAKFRLGAEAPQAEMPFLQGLEHLDELHQEDTYLDTPESVLYKKGIFLRERRIPPRDGGEGKRLIEIKYQEHQGETWNKEAREHKFSERISGEKRSELAEWAEKFGLAVPDGDFTWDEFSALNKFEKLVTVNKNRTRYKKGAFVVSVDTVEGLPGTYVEVEQMLKERDDPKVVEVEITKVVDQFKKESSGVRWNAVDLGYAELLLRKTDPQIYDAGPSNHHLSRDRYNAFLAKKGIGSARARSMRYALMREGRG